MAWIDGDALTPQNLNSKAGMGAIINVQDPTYGALGDGSTDDTTAIQAAFDASSEGDTIFFPVGQYILSAPLMFPSPSEVELSKLRIRGEQTYNGARLIGTHAGNIIQFPSADVVEIDHLTFEGAGCSGIRQTPIPAGTRALSSSMHVHHCIFKANLEEGIHVNGLHISYIEKNLFGVLGPTGATHRHIFAQGNGQTRINFVKIRDNRFFAAVGSFSIEIDDGTHLEIEDNTFDINLAPCIAIRGLGVATVRNNWFEGNIPPVGTPFYILLEDSVTGLVNQTVVFDSNHWNPNDPGDVITHLIEATSTGAVTKISFINNHGAGMAGKNITRYETVINDGMVDYYNNSLQGFSRDDFEESDRNADAFSVFDSSANNNVTGDSTTVTVVYDTVNVSNLANVVVATGIHTAAHTGMYIYSSVVELGGLLSTHVDAVLSIVTSNRTFTKRINPFAISVSGVATIDFTVGAFMDADDTTSVTLQVSGGTLVVDVRESHFSAVRSPHA